MKIITPFIINDEIMTSSIPDIDTSRGEVEWESRPSGDTYRVQVDGSNFITSGSFVGAFFHVFNSRYYFLSNKDENGNANPTIFSFYRRGEATELKSYIRIGLSGYTMIDGCATLDSSNEIVTNDEYSVLWQSGSNIAIVKFINNVASVIGYNALFDTAKGFCTAYVGGELRYYVLNRDTVIQPNRTTVRSFRYSDGTALALYELSEVSNPQSIVFHGSSFSVLDGSGAVYDYNTSLASGALVQYVSTYTNQFVSIFHTGLSYFVVSNLAAGGLGSPIAQGWTDAWAERTETEAELPPYEAGDQVVVPSENKIYQAATQTRDYPLDGLLLTPPSWVRVSATNKYKAFDYVINTKSIFDSSSTAKVTLTPSVATTSLAVFGMSRVESVSVEVFEDSELGTQIYTSTVSTAIDAPIDDLVVNDSYLDDKIIIDDLPVYATPCIVITFNSTSSTLEVGDIVIGNSRSLGVTTYQSSTSRTSYDTVDTDDFGNEVITSRPSAEYTSFEVMVYPQYANYVERILKDSLNKPRVYVSDKGNDEKIFTFGYYERSPLTYSSPTVCETTLKVRGLV